MFAETYLLLLSFLPSALASPAGAPSVSLSYGSFKGATSGNLSMFLGVPYAAPADRFTLPTPPVPFRGVKPATDYGPACPQQALSPLGLGEGFVSTYTSMSDDCLTLDVFAPRSATKRSNLPVFVWIYGGGFEVGFKADNDVRGMVERSLVLQEPVVVVVPNYRLSAYGFMGGKDIAQAGLGNLGLRDQIFALEWSKNTFRLLAEILQKSSCAGGLSAGAISVSTILLTNKMFEAGTLFRGAFMMSGAPIPAPSILSTTSQASYDSLVAANNCTGSRDTLACLRRVPLEAFSATVNATADFFSFTSSNLLWRPRVDGAVVLQSPLESVKQGRFSKIPFITGNTDDEGTDFSWSSTNITTNDEFIGYLSSTLLPFATPAQIARIAELYPDDPTLGSPFGTGTDNQLTPEYKRIAASQGDFIFQTERRFLLQQAAKRGQKSWSYLDKRLKSVPFYGSLHGGDTTTFLPTVNTTDFVAADFLLNFVNTLDPNKGSLPSRAWPTWGTPSSAGNTSLLTLFDPDSVNITAEDFRLEQRDYMDGVLASGASVGP
ncbi:Carboxylic ester hydrolase [Mycena kentingensis (nom. inval.)]|nr:Carboxylic ester hydrolase [Mycena kentingensis (nom. inval.)]